MVELKNVWAGYTEADKPIKDLSIVIQEPGVVALLGASGRGKTTFLRLMMGLLPEVEGVISGLDGKRISVVFQEDRLLPWLSAKENIAIICDDEKRVNEILNNMELEDVAHKYPKELSGGMQRRVALARALAFGGDILLLDEPFKGLDDDLKTRIIARIKDSFPLMILATHDIKDVYALGCTLEVRL